MSSATIPKAHAVDALQKLSALAAGSKIVLELALCHGSLVVVAYHANGERRGPVRPNDIAVDLIDAVREELRLRVDWLETDIVSFISNAAAMKALRPEEFAPGLVISVNGSARVLAQKLHLLREAIPTEATDSYDAEFLIRKISITSPGQIKYIYARAFPDFQISLCAQEPIERAFQPRPGVKA